MGRALLGFPSSFAPHRYRQRTSRAGPGRLSTDLELLDHISLILQSGSSLVSCDRRRTVHSTSAAPDGRRARVAGGAEEPLLARRVRSSKRRRHDAYAAPRRRRTRTRSRRLSLRLRERLCSPAQTPRCRRSSGGEAVGRGSSWRCRRRSDCVHPHKKWAHARGGVRSGHDRLSRRWRAEARRVPAVVPRLVVGGGEPDDELETSSPGIGEDPLFGRTVSIQRTACGRLNAVRPAYERSAILSYLQRHREAGMVLHLEKAIPG